MNNHVTLLFILITFVFSIKGESQTVKNHWPKEIKTNEDIIPKVDESEDDNPSALIEMKVHILLNQGKIEESLKLANQILDKNPSLTDGHLLKIKIFETQKDYLQVIEVYEDLIFLQYNGLSLFDEPKGSLDSEVLSYVLNIGIQYFNLFIELKSDDPKKEEYFLSALKYFDLMKVHDYSLFYYHFYLEQMYFERDNYFLSFYNIYKIESSDKILTNEQLSSTLMFYKALNQLNSNQRILAIRNFKYLEDKLPEEKIGKTSKELGEKLSKTRFNGFFSLTRGLNTNPTSVASGDRKTKSFLEGPQYFRGLLSINLNDTKVSKNSNYFFDFSGLALTTQQDEPHLDNYVSAFGSLSAKIKNNTWVYLPFIQYTFSDLYLNQLSSGNYELKNFSKAHELRFSWASSHILGAIEWNIPIGYTIELDNSDNNYYTFGFEMNWSFWRLEAFMDPFLNLNFKRDIYPKKGRNDELTSGLTLGNNFNFEASRLSIQTNYERVHIFNIAEVEYTYGLRTKWSIPVTFFSPSIQTSFTLSFERRKRTDPFIEYINQESFEWAGIYNF